jgi:hypothetical protein
MDWYRAKLESDKFQLSKHRIFVADVEVRVLAEWDAGETSATHQY